MFLKRINKKLFLSALLIMLSIAGWAQRTMVTGFIRDAKTNEAIPFASVSFDGTTIGDKSNFDGEYILVTDQELTRVKVTSVGYETKIFTIKYGEEQTVDVALKPNSKTLQVVKIQAKKEKYRNRDNPAVELIKQVIDHKGENRKEGFDYFEYEKYEKIQMAVSNVSQKFQHKKVFKKFQFVFDNIDTTTLEDKNILPIYLKESLSDVFYRKNPTDLREISRAAKNVAFEGYVDNRGVDAYMKNMYQDIDIYDNEIQLLSNRFLSPISVGSPTFYKFFIIDTITQGDNKFARLAFFPRNKQSFLFQGDMLIAFDNSYAVTKIEMGVNKNINLNWVKEIKIIQKFEKDPEQGYKLVYDEFSADFGISDNGMGMFAQRTTSYKNYKVNIPRPNKDYLDTEKIPESVVHHRSEDFWKEHRHSELSRSEKGIYTVVDSLKKMPAFRRTMDIVVMLFAGYVPISPYFELGPVSTFYSYNPIEGLRLRAGGRTTNAFSEKVVLEGYGAYGFKDTRWKYFGGVTYSLSDRNVYEFPVRAIRANVQHETKIPGQDLEFVQEDNILLSLKRGVNDKLLYNTAYNISYLHETRYNFSVSVGLKQLTQEAAGSLHFNRVEYNNPTFDLENITTSELNLTARWAPNEEFYQGKTYRIPLTFRNPIFTFRYNRGFKDFLGGQYDFRNMSLNIYKRFYLSQLGYTDVTLEGGKTYGEVPYPLLSIHRANQTYAYQLQSFNMMNFLEFVSDQYASINIDHSFNGFIFNRLPLIKKLKWREAISAKILYGSVSDKNNPESNNSLLKFPKQEDGNPITHTLNDGPYIEGSVAIANIFKFFRIDLVKRFTYLNNPNVSEFGIRARFKVDF